MSQTLPERLIEQLTPSILQDLEAGRPMEIGTLLEAPLALACAKGIAAPMLEMLVALVRLRAAVSR